jgi:uncharacterized phage infection (PIP) family protein YhgE
VTSENLAEFQAEKLGLADKVVEETPADQSEPETEAKATEERKPKIERRFENITKQREAARAEAQAERQAREVLEEKLKQYESKPEKVTEEVEPRPEQFTDMYEYAKALTDYRVEQRLGEEKQKEVQAKIAAEREQVINTWASRVKAAKAEMPDFEDMVGSADVSVSNEVRDAIFESEVGPRVLYHLAENPEIAQKLQGMTLSAALRTIGKLEAQFEVSAKPVVEKSKAPAPISPIRSAANGRDVNLNSDGNFHGSYQAWKAGRLAGRIR